MKVWHIIFLAILGIANCENVKTIFSWKQLDYEFPNETTRDAYISSESYIPKNNVLDGFAVWENKMFITVGRWKKGVASNLNYVVLNETDYATSPKLIPYPSLESNDINNLSENTTVDILRPRVDACNRLWLLDNGIEGVSSFDPRQLLPPRLIVIDLKTDAVILTYTLKDSDYELESLFANIVIDEDKDSCENTFAYIFDTFGYSLVVYSWAEKKSWRVKHDSFHPDPEHDYVSVLGLQNAIQAGPIGGFLLKAEDNDSKILYYHALSSTTEFAVSNLILKNETLATVDNEWTNFSVGGDKGDSTQGLTSVLDPKTNIAYFAQSNRQSLVCWNTHLSLNPESFHPVLNHRSRVHPISDNDVAISSETNTLYILSGNVATILYGIEFIENNFITAVSLEHISKYCYENETETFFWPNMIDFA